MIYMISHNWLYERKNQILIVTDNSADVEEIYAPQIFCNDFILYPVIMGNIEKITL